MTKPSLYMTSNLVLALEIKLREGCPHIHCNIEDDCDEFTATVVWLDVMSKGIENAKVHGSCVISINEMRPSGNITPKERKLIAKWDRKIKASMEELEVVDVF